MSAEAMGWVLRHSPFRGTTLLVHVCIADVVNDQHGNECWMTVQSLSRKARAGRRTVTTSLTELREAGFLTLLTEGLTGHPNRYRFEYPDVPVVYETRARQIGATQSDNGVTPAPKRLGGQAETANLNSIELKGTQTQRAQHISDAFDRIADDRTRSRSDLRNPAAFKRRVRKSLDDELGERATELLDGRPSLTVSQLAAALEGSNEVLRLIPRRDVS